VRERRARLRCLPCPASVLPRPGPPPCCRALPRLRGAVPWPPSR